jgi:hypothetical protein
MAESKFTKAPWHVTGPSEEPSAAKRVFSGSTYLGTVTNTDMDPDEIAANAELWADAPRMLEVLRALCEYAIPEDGVETLARHAFDEAAELLEKHGG